MNLFIETPQQSAARLLREQRSQAAAAAMPVCAGDLDEPSGFEPPPTYRPDLPPRAAGAWPQGRAAAYPSGWPAPAYPDGAAPATRAAAPAYHGDSPGAPAPAYPPGAGAPWPQGPNRPPDATYSLEQEAYRDEIAYGKRRDRRRKLLALVRILVCIVAVPLVLLAAFVAAYALTCIMSGASPDEVVGLLQNLFERARGFVSDAVASR